ncbi:unnamed protein product [Brachionus calyciflorus]|uniref:DUF4549 domain-containing protein n=1 Tax=Brachionus calyciflorus TaxID=104777 RepID=A0A813YHA2_9BILA|nr:unnamed protein product [Brachionus calyciflorus]
MWLNEAAANYKYLNNEPVKKAEEQLQIELNELKREIETNELVHGIGFNRSFTSVPVPKDAQLLAKERKLYIEKMLQVHDIRKPYIQAELMIEQNENCLKEEYTTESLPLILHQFFLDRISWSIQAKHAHLLRWKRFSEHTSIIEDMYINFKNRIGYILSDYNDSLKRSQRLSQARELLLATNSCTLAMNSIEIEDIEIYLRWLMSHFYSQKTFLQAVKLLEWLPYEIFFDSNSSNPILTNTNQSDSLSTNRTSRYKGSNSDRNDILDSIRQSTESNKNINSSSTGSLLINKFKYLDNIYLPSTNANVPRDEILNTVSYMFNQDQMPVHDNTLDYLMPRLRFLVNFYKIDYNLSRMQTSGDEMELFAAVNRKYRHLFTQQEHMKTFRTYDSIELLDENEIGSENWGADSSIHALKKESNWLDYIQLVPQKDSIYEKDISKLKQKHSIDQYLLSHNSFLEIKNDERVQEALRENSTLVKKQPNVEAVSVTTNITQFNTTSLWKKIFHNPNIDSKNDKPTDNLDLLNSNNESQVAKPISFRSKTNKKQDEFNFIENLQKLGLDDSKTNDQNLSNVQGSYLSFLLLRHLRIRDLKRQALGFLNFYRSIEKTITIYDGGLSLESSNYKRTSAQNYSKETPYGGNLGNHSYIFNTPKDFRLNEAEFMEFSEIENHDDFYSVDEKGFVHVQDQRGYFIMYDAALSDIKKLENELLMVASYYIAKDKETFEGPSSSKTKQQPSGSGQNINLGYYSHQNVDRFSVLLDIWSNEVNFLEMKKNLLEIYYEAYQNVFDKTEKRNLAQIITNIIHQRVRFDLHSDYFTQSYRLEISCLNKQCRIVKSILDRMIDEMRNYLEKVDDSKNGLPFTLIKKNPINLSSNLYGHTLKNFYLLEFHPCLASASRLPQAFKQAIEELAYFKSVQNVTERLILEQNFYNIYLDKLEKLDPPGYSFTPQIQKEIFNGTYIEDPILMSDFVQQGIKQVEETSKHKTRKEQTDALLKFMSNTLEMITIRHRLLSASFETETISKLYRRLAIEMGFEEFHMYLRYVQFDFAKYKENAGSPPPVFVSELNSEDSQIDRYVPNNLYLTINELEEGQIGRLSFKAKENIQHILRPGGLDNLQLILKLQLMHNNSLISSIMQANACLLSNNLAVRNNKNSIGLNNPGNSQTEEENYVNKFQENSMFNIKQFNNALGTSSNDNTPSIRISTNVSKLKKFSEAFISIQLEKVKYFFNYLKVSKYLS